MKKKIIFSAIGIVLLMAGIIIIPLLIKDGGQKNILYGKDNTCVVYSLKGGKEITSQTVSGSAITWGCDVEHKVLSSYSSGEFYEWTYEKQKLKKKLLTKIPEEEIVEFKGFTLGNQYILEKLDTKYRFLEIKTGTVFDIEGVNNIDLFYKDCLYIANDNILTKYLVTGESQTLDFGKNITSLAIQEGKVTASSTFGSAANKSLQYVIDDDFKIVDLKAIPINGVLAISSSYGYQLEGTWHQGDSKIKIPVEASELFLTKDLTFFTVKNQLSYIKNTKVHRIGSIDNWSQCK